MLVIWRETSDLLSKALNLGHRPFPFDTLVPIDNFLKLDIYIANIIFGLSTAILSDWAPFIIRSTIVLPPREQWASLRLPARLLTGCLLLLLSTGASRSRGLGTFSLSSRLERTLALRATLLFTPSLLLDGSDRLFGFRWWLLLGCFGLIGGKWIGGGEEPSGCGGDTEAAQEKWGGLSWRCWFL